MPDLMHLTIGTSELSVPPSGLSCRRGAWPGFIHGPCSLGSASVGSYPPLPEVGRFSLCTGSSFGSPKVTSDLQAQMETDSSFGLSTEPHGGLQDFVVLPNAAASTLPRLDPLEVTSMGDIQNLVDSQIQQTCKYDLLSSLPRKCPRHGGHVRRILQGLRFWFGSWRHSSDTVCSCSYRSGPEVSVPGPDDELPDSQ